MSIQDYTDVRSFLNSVREAKIERKRCEVRLHQLWDQTQSITAQLKEIPIHGNGSPQKDDALIALAEQSAKLKEMRMKWIAQINEVEEFIDQIEDPTRRIILKMRYCDLSNWSDIVAQLHLFDLYYTERHVLRIHGDALQDARKLWEETRNVDIGSSQENE